MSGKWAAALVPGGKTTLAFEALLRERIEKDYEVEDDLIEHTLAQLRDSQDRQQLTEELTEVFDDGAGPISDWCWDTLTRLTALAAADAVNDPPINSSEAAETSPAETNTEHAAEAEQREARRAPIQFNLQASVPETLPKKASEQKAQQLGGRKPAAAAAAAAAAATKTEAAEAKGALVGTAASSPAQHVRAPPGSTADSSKQRTASAASARMLHMTGLIRPSADSTRDSRARQRQQEQHTTQQKPVEGRQPVQQQQQQPPRKRPLEEPQEKDAARSSVGSRRTAAVSAGPGSVFRSAVSSLKPEKGSKVQPGDTGVTPLPPQQQQQTASGPKGVFARIAKNDLARLAAESGVPQVQHAAPKQPQRCENPTTKQQQQQRQQVPKQQQSGHTSYVEGLPRSLQGRLGVGVSQRPSGDQHSPLPTAIQQGAAPAGGTKRKVNSEAGTRGEPQAATSVAAAPQPHSIRSGQQQQQQQHPLHQEQVSNAKRVRVTPATPATQTTAATATAAAATKAAGTAAATGAGGQEGSAAAELAALRAQLEARQAEVQRLKQVQESDQCSVVVCGVSPRAPEAVVRAHFGACGASIKRCTLLPGRLHSASAPGAYIEFEVQPGNAARSAKEAATKALKLTGSQLLDQNITVTRKSDWKMHQAKGQRSYTALRSAAAPPYTTTHRTWKGAGSAGGAASVGGGATSSTAAVAAAVELASKAGVGDA